jgi:hypothetical protein
MIQKLNNLILKQSFIPYNIIRILEWTTTKIVRQITIDILIDCMDKYDVVMLLLLLLLTD